MLTGLSQTTGIENISSFQLVLPVNTLILDSLCPLLVLCDTLKGVTPLILHIKVCLKVSLSVEKGCVNGLK